MGKEVIGRPSISFGVGDFVSAEGVKVVISHNGEEGTIVLDGRGFKAVHDDLATSVELAVNGLGEAGINDLEEEREIFFGTEDGTGEVDVVIHKVVGVERDLVFVFIFEQEVVVELFDPIVLEEPGFVVTLPSDMEGSAIPDDGITG
jgi:hypothetical protein